MRCYYITQLLCFMLQLPSCFQALIPCNTTISHLHTMKRLESVQTDIKEAVFLGDNDELVAAGSDLGHVFIYNAATGEV